jgi:uncharacterized protein YjbI with pentapeptide repeats
MRQPEEIIIEGKTLREILDQNLTWFETGRQEGKSAELSGADLFQADMCEVNLYEADLSGANLSGAFLSKAHLLKAKLTGANLFQVDLSDANLIEADLSGANLTEAFLCNANLLNAKLTGANLNEAKLIGANLFQADLSEANLFQANLSGAILISAKMNKIDLSEAFLITANLSEAHLIEAIMTKSNLFGASLSGADLSKADLSEADLSQAICVKTNFTNAKLDNARIYGISVWDIQTKGLEQNNLIITKPEDSEITVDSIEVAQFIYLILNNNKLKDVLGTITSKVVLILGRFTPERKIVLDALREGLRQYNFTPVVFDFEKPADKNITETVSTLAHMARFVIADLTDAKSIPQELQRIVPDLPSLPVQPIILESQFEYSMFKDFLDYSWVLLPHRYANPDDLLASLSEKVIGPALDKSKEIEKRRKQIEEELSKK